MIVLPLTSVKFTVVAPATLIEQLIKGAFAPSLNQPERSQEYIDGTRAALLQNLVGKPLACKYKLGTAAADAFFAGVDEGRAIHAKYISSQSAAALNVDPYAGLKGHDYIKARNLAPPVQRRVQTSAHTQLNESQA